jgi:hypothetical protein
MNSKSENAVHVDRPDRLTLIAISCLAYVLAVALHEHAGHSAACVLLGSHVKEMGAFYVDCDETGLTDLGQRLVALAGPLVSLLTGIVGVAVARRMPRSSRCGHYFSWLVGSLGLMSAAGYPLFSGILGLGDLGTTRDGAFYGVAPEWLWRIVLTVIGAFAYREVLKIMWRTMAPQLSAVEPVHIETARRTTMTSYFAGAVLYAAIGVLNPHGFLIIAISVLPSSLGGTCGLLVMWSMIHRYPAPAPQAPSPGLNFARSWTWIGVASVITIAYAAILGPTFWP